MRIECCSGFYYARMEGTHHIESSVIGFFIVEYDKQGEMIACHEKCPFCGKKIQVEVKP